MVERERLSGVDAAWLHMDRPSNSADIVAVMTFADRLPAAAARRLVEERLLRHARFRQRVVEEGPLRIATWHEDRGFSLRRHVLSRRLPPDGTRALQRFTGAVASEPLEAARPLWRVYVVDGFGAGSALVAKLHHCLGDGFALVGVLLSLADEAAATDAMPQRTPAHRDLSAGMPVAEVLRTALRGPRRALDLAARGATFARSLARMAALPPDPPTRLSRALSGRRRTAFSAPIPLAEVRDRARAAGATSNDVLVAALAGALRTVLGGGGPPPPDVRALVPVNLRERLPSPDGPLGNRFGLVFLPLPLASADPGERLALVRARMAALKRSPDAVVTYGVLDAIGHLPAVERVVTEFFSRKASLVVTNVPGPRARLHLGGHEIDGIMFNVPHPATLGLGVSILSYAGEVRLGARADVAVLPHPGALVRAFPREVRAFH